MSDEISRKRPAEESEETDSKKVAVGEGDGEAPTAVKADGESAEGAVPAEAKEPRLTMKALILSKDVGAIIGKGGASIKAIREGTGCRVIIGEAVANTNERILTVLGPPAAVPIAYSQIAHRLQEEGANAALSQGQAPGKLSLNLLVATSQIGPIIGKGGSKIKEIREATGAHLSVATEQLPGSTERTVTVSGDAEAVGKAISCIGEIIFANPPKGPVVHFRPQARMEQLQAMAVAGVPGMYQQQQQYGQNVYGMPPGMPGMPGMHGNIGGMPQQPKANPQLPGPGETTQIVTIPNDYIGAIIGKAGVKINEIRQLSNTRIKINEPQPGALERQVILTGTPEACQTACYMLNTRLQQEIARRQAGQ
eukprot:comp18172_c0_seq1/m.18982 comp18172_c0_seq1/g.18982  ORF comp18172_c0_seq1/g.18982 comp18172_c0_seq1/m.18982 type:complete len:366 (-) comp18172_c0_seq1:264-1361(-)